MYETTGKFFSKRFYVNIFFNIKNIYHPESPDLKFKSIGYLKKKILTYAD
ncbi:MAG: hypothetical protein CM1200mP30_05640 [Pseudomonadota bacterium]|nr:MAG: hypothetical protein CM1200mP30_05640 [Pseudomonadota bacterium]